MVRLPRTRRAYLHSAISGLAGFLALYIIAHQVLARFGIRAENTYVDDVLMGLLVAILVIALEAQHEFEILVEKHRTQTMMQLNHHIRNALQTIVYVNSGNPNTEDAVKVAQATERIDWALREVSRQANGENETDVGPWSSRGADGSRTPRASA